MNVLRDTGLHKSSQQIKGREYFKLGSIIGPKSVIGSNSVIKPHVVIDANQVIPDSTVISTSIKEKK